MKAFRWVLIAVAVVLAVAGIVISLLPYDASVPAPALAGEGGLTFDVSCPAPAVDLLTDDEPDDGWLNYSPNEGAVFEADGRAGGEYCADTMRTRGILGVVLVLAAVCVAAAAVLSGYRRRSDERTADPVDDPAARPEGADDQTDPTDDRTEAP